MLAPSPATVRAACEEFDRENETLEGALQELFAAYPHNTTRRQVFLKVTVLNAHYSTLIPAYSLTRTDLYDITESICQNGAAIDSAFTHGLAKIVDQMAQPEISEKKKPYRCFSFATKYASWHRPDCYPIWDSRVRACLLWLQREWGFARDFAVDGDWKYPAFHELISRLRQQYDLEALSFKQIDKFLYLVGGVLKARAKENRRK